MMIVNFEYILVGYREHSFFVCFFIFLIISFISVSSNLGFDHDDKESFHSYTIIIYYIRRLLIYN